MRRSIPTDVAVQEKAPTQQPVKGDNWCGTVPPGAKKPAQKLKDGDWAKLSGTIMIREGMMGIGGESPPGLLIPHARQADLLER